MKWVRSFPFVAFQTLTTWPVYDPAARMRPGLPNTLALRPAGPDDLEFALGVARETMRDYVIATWGSWSEDRTRSGLEKLILDRQTQIIELAGVPIGIESVERTSEHVRLLQLFIRPAHQRRGIGSELVGRLIQEAQQKKLPLKLRVLKVNPAQSLYRRVGFAMVSTTTEHVYMEYAS